MDTIQSNKHLTAPEVGRMRNTEGTADPGECTSAVAFMPLLLLLLLVESLRVL
jgi:hypothetical protein